jgi:hypothetical protein
MSSATNETLALVIQRASTVALRELNKPRSVTISSLKAAVREVRLAVRLIDLRSAFREEVTAYVCAEGEDRLPHLERQLELARELERVEADLTREFERA